MFYLNFLNDKCKVSYISGTPKGENHYHIHEEHTHLTLSGMGGPILLSGLHTPRYGPAFVDILTYE